MQPTTQCKESVGVRSPFLVLIIWKHEHTYTQKLVYSSSFTYISVQKGEKYSTKNTGVSYSTMSKQCYQSVLKSRIILF